MITKDEFQKYYKTELNNFRNGVVAEKTEIKKNLHNKFRTQGYDEVIGIREQELKKKV
jgi:hypothetical protein